MKFKNPKTWGTAIGAGVFASLVMLPQARGELVYETELQQQPQAQPVAVAAPVARSEDRENLRQVIQSSEKAQTTLQVPTPVAPLAAPAPVQTAQVVVQAQPVAAAVAAPAQVQVGPPAEIEGNASKSELMRRARVRAELRNEDLLQERLEELRLRDEKRRMDSLMGASASSGPVFGNESVAVAAPVVVAPAPVQTEVVGAAAAAPLATDQITVTHAAAVSASVANADASSDRLAILVGPRGGFSNMTGNNYYDIRPHYSAGVELGLAISDNVSFDVAYQFSEYGVALNSTNPYVANYQAWAGSYGYTGTFESVAMKQNVGEAGVKVHVLGPDSRLRPFLGAGAAYSRSFVNYDSRILTVLNQSGLQALGDDYEMSQFLGTVSTGLDVRVSKSISIGATFKYYTVLSSRQNSNLNNMAMYNGYSGYNPYNYYYGLNDTDKQMVGGSLATSSFYSILGGVTFAF